MNCPRCHTELKQIMLGNIQVDTCDSCEGIWFDGDELTKVLDGLGEALKDSLAGKSWEGEGRERIEKLGVSDLVCPKCGRGLQKIRYCYSSEILVDSCESCGLWLDDSELRKVYEYLKTSEIKMTPELSQRIRAAYKEEKLDPAKKNKLIKALERIELEAAVEEEKMIDGMVGSDDRAGLMRPMGVLLQFIYRIFYRLGL